MSTDYDTIAAAIRYLEANFTQQPSLEDLAAHLHLSPYHLQRLFKRWAGISPKRFLQFLTADYARQLLDESHSVLDAAYASGLSGPGRLHDLFVSIDAVTPGEYKQKGAGLAIDYGFHHTPFGQCLIAITARGICALSFVEEDDRQAAIEALGRRWAGARLSERPALTQPLIDAIFPAGDSPSQPAQPTLPLFLQGTNFQVKVWEALLAIPAGHALSYEDVAHAIGQPAGTQAVASAVAANQVAFLIPCHRVLRKSGAVGEYRWGHTRKQAMLGWEAAQRRGEATD
jgi:AraC family transcriptional regulator of adaptative response/methylated-DNA-[protein]-cysteine methyltransferase